MGTLQQDFRFAWRMLQRNPAFTALVMLALALGIGANTAMFTVLHGVLLRPLPFAESDRLMLLSNLPKNWPFPSGPALLDSHFLAFRKSDQLFESLAAYSQHPVNLTGAGDPIRLPAAGVTADFFTLLRVNAVKGRTFALDEEQEGRNHVVLLGDKLWKSHFSGDASVVGKTIQLDGVGHTVIGVLPPRFAFPYEAELWVPQVIRLSPNRVMMMPVAGRLKPGATPEQARAELETFTAHLPADANGKRGQYDSRVSPLKEFLVHDVRSSLQVFSVAVLFVLLIACVNVANLLLIRASRRQQEMAVRGALGAGRWRIVRQLLTESTLLSLLGGVAGVLVALWAIPALLAMAPKGKLPRVDEIHIDGWVLAFTAGIAVLTGIVAGLAPALQVARRDLRPALSQEGRGSTGHERVRNGLVILEVALALILLSAAGLMVKSYLRLRSVPLGYQTANVLTMTVDLPNSVYRTVDQSQDFHRRTLEKLAAAPGAISAGAINWQPLGPARIQGDFHLEDGRKLPKNYSVIKPAVSAGYFRTLGIEMISGREFNDGDKATARGVIIISQSVAREFWDGRDPIGQRIALDDNPKPEDWLTIVGVTGDIRQKDLGRKPEPAIYQPIAQVKRTFFLDHMSYAIRTAPGDTRMAAAMRTALRSIDPNQPVQSLASMDDLLSATTAEPRFQMRLLAAFSGLALALAAIGIYGVLSYSVVERTREIGIRMALGAKSGDLVTLVLSRTLLLTTAGVAAGTLGALAVTRGMTNFLFEVRPNDPLTYVAVSAMLATVALLAGWIPARRASRMDPLVALRHE